MSHPESPIPASPEERFQASLDELRSFQSEDEPIKVGQSELTVYEHSIQIFHPANSLEGEWSTVYSLAEQGRMYGAPAGQELKPLTGDLEKEAVVRMLEDQVATLKAASKPAA